MGTDRMPQVVGGKRARDVNAMLGIGIQDIQKKGDGVLRCRRKVIGQNRKNRDHLEGGGLGAYLGQLGQA